VGENRLLYSLGSDPAGGKSETSFRKKAKRGKGVVSYANKMHDNLARSNPAQKRGEGLKVGKGGKRKIQRSV